MLVEKMAKEITILGEVSVETITDIDAPNKELSRIVARVTTLNVIPNASIPRRRRGPVRPNRAP